MFTVPGKIHFWGLYILVDIIYEKKEKDNSFFDDGGKSIQDRRKSLGGKSNKMTKKMGFCPRKRKKPLAFPRRVQKAIF